MINYFLKVIILMLISSTVLSQSAPSFIKDFLKVNDVLIVDTYSNEFENISDFDGHYIVPQDHLNSSSHDFESEIVYSGLFAHRAWMYATNEYIVGRDDNHRAYPTLQLALTNLVVVSPLVIIDIYVLYDIDIFDEFEKDWFSIATYTSYSDNNWFRTQLVNLDHNYRMHLMHVPTQGVSKPTIFQSKVMTMPKKEWVRVTTMIDYSSTNRFKSPIIAVWQNGELASASTFVDRINPYNISPESSPLCLDNWDGASVESAELACGLSYEAGLAQVHFGMYAPSGLSSGVVFNDALTINKAKVIE